MAKLLDLNSPSSDDDFAFVKADVEAQRFVELLWQDYAKYADPGFAQVISTNFHSRYWEMHLACALLTLGNHLAEKRQSFGPDVCILSAEGRVWLEATACTAGIGADRVPEPNWTEEECLAVPENQIVLRYSSAIAAKYERYVEYLAVGLVSTTEPFVIALNGLKVPFSNDDAEEVPYVVQSVLPVGTMAFDLNWDDPTSSRVVYPYRPYIVKQSGAQVSTRIFTRPEFSAISGILFSRACIESFHLGLGHDFVFVHNPLARNSLPIGWLKCRREFWVEEGYLRWSSNQQSNRA